MRFLIICLGLAIAHVNAAEATVGADSEAPRVAFKRDGDNVVASLIPRAKSTTVHIAFAVSTGRLVEVKDMNFKSAARPEVDHKDFKSNLFIVSVADITKGSEIRLTVSSDFFSKSTEFWAFNSDQKPSWMNTQADNQSQTNLVRSLTITVKDGGPRDSDGASDGRLTLIGGPKDSFWGYALGTLFIRFFGIFIVLGILMIGMMLSGKVFNRMEAQKKAAERPPESKGIAPGDDTGKQLPPEDRPPAERSTEQETAAAIAAALHMHLSERQRAVPLRLQISESSPWTHQGRQRIMQVRYINNRHKS
jgi:Na+-transporting methylmalonyl-CoA/oxaloacetate decarboxylase gamma subunit